MPPTRRKGKVFFPPAEDQIDYSSPVKRAYHKRPVVETAATARPKRGESEIDNKSRNVSVSVRKSTTPASSQLSTLPSSKVATTPTPVKRGRGRPSFASLANEASTASPTKRGRGRPSASVSAKPSTIITPAKKRGRPSGSVSAKNSSTVALAKKRGRPSTKKTVNEEPALDKSEVNFPIPAKPHIEADDYDVANYDNEDLEDPRGYWLMKAEPESRLEKGVDVRFSIDDLEGAIEPEPWDGVRNPAARNHMRAMRKGDHAFFYHSNCKVPGIAGIMEIVQEHSVDETAFDPSHPYYDAKSDREHPKWYLVHVEFRHKFESLVGLAELKSYGKPGGALEKLQTLKQTRLSVSAVTAKEWKFILSLASDDAKPVSKKTKKG